MKTLWQRTSSSIGLLFVALGVLLAHRNGHGHFHEGTTRTGSNR
ncbi:MAG: hypothetical protein P8049_10775 [Gemmatimonadota bacterium]|jgi:hypothetical protein